MKMVRFLTAILVLAILASSAEASNTVTLTSGYPKAGCSSGTIFVDGTYSLDSGWSLVGTGFTIYVWQDGLEVTTVSAAGFFGSFSQTISSLNSSVTYNVFVEMTITNGCDTIIIATLPATVTTN
ncbi:MAG: hypothetical protein U0793_15035 [Gemmataceae bacterium]